MLPNKRAHDSFGDAFLACSISVSLWVFVKIIFFIKIILRLQFLSSMDEQSKSMGMCRHLQM